MKSIQILEDADAVNPEDWCRPLSLSTMSRCSDSYSFKDCYTGTPENNVKWVKVKYILGNCWHGKSVKEIDQGLGKFVKYEFIRGSIPDRSKLSLNGYNITDHTKVFCGEDDV